MDMEKSTLRKQILIRRDSLLQAERQAWDRDILAELIRYEEAAPCPVYLCYVSYKSEVDTRGFIDWCLGHGKAVFVPKVFTKGSGKKPTEMEFYRIFRKEDLRAGYQGIPEPEALFENSFGSWIQKSGREDRSLSVRIILPGTVFDKTGNRIGYGGGFYDRWLAKWEAKSAGYFRGTFEKIGLAYSIQIVEELPAEIFDRKADAVLTESGMSR